ncbi:YdcF family protein [Putridiphycobacter roseus]|nr:YdcF family protein [Putridiphycobacter roseus]
MRGWEIAGQKVESVGHYDVAVVLGGMSEYNNDLERLSIRRGGDRLWQALQLYYAKKVDKILISGNNGHLIDRGLCEAVQFKEDLIKMGVPAQDILVEANSKNTHENATETRKLIKENQSIILVTSALHMKRSIGCFKKAGFNNFATFSTDHYTGKNRGYYLDQYFIPSASAIVEWNALIKEWIGTLMYWMMGYV